MIFLLRNQQNECRSYIRQVNLSGCLTIELGVLHDALSESNWYGLYYQRQGETHPLLEVTSDSQTISMEWGLREICCSGL